MALLREFRIQAVADIRRFPGSRKFPHFHREALREATAAEGIGYHWIEALGGRREGREGGDSPNQGLDSPGFRQYADHMGTDPFRREVDALIEIARARATVLLCAEKLFSRCHRRLLCDYLLARGIATAHIVEPGRLVPHELSGGARVIPEGGVIYP